MTTSTVFRSFIGFFGIFERYGPNLCVDVAVAQAFKGVTPGVTNLGLKEGGVDVAIDEHNAKLVTADMKKKVDAARADIVAGKIKVIDYMAANACK